MRSLPCVLAFAAVVSADPIRTSDFPTVAQRVSWFERRINAPQAEIRERVVREVAYFGGSDDELVRFLRRMARDRDPVVCGRALKERYWRWLSVDPKELPRRIAGYAGEEIIDRDDPDHIRKLTARLHNGPSAGWAVYALAILQAKEALPAIRKVVEHDNIFVRCTAARALLACGDRDGAGALFDELSAAQLEIYGGAKGSRSPWYAWNACRGLIELGDKRGFARALELWRHLDLSPGGDDQSKSLHVRNAFADLTGMYFFRSDVARRWFDCEFAAREVAVATAAPIRAADFPAVSKRARWFEVRINAPDPKIRRSILSEVGYFTGADKELERFLRRMLRDPDPAVRGWAVQELYKRWILLDESELPRRFSGYTDSQIIDRDDPDQVDKLLAHLHLAGPGAGYAVYALGILRTKQAIPRMRALKSHGNVYVRHATARALLACGDREGAREIFSKTSAEQLAIYSGARVQRKKPPSLQLAANEVAPPEREPWYAWGACRGLIEAGDPQGFPRAVKLWRFLESSEEVNDKSNLHYVRVAFADVAGRYFRTSDEAEAWVNRQKKR